MYRKIHHSIGRISCFRLLPLAVLALCGLQVRAEMAAGIVDLDELVIMGGPDAAPWDVQRIFELPAGIPGNLAEGLEEVAGINLIRRGAFTGEPMIRGLGSDRVATSFNGLRLPNGAPTRTHAPAGQFGGVLYRSVELALFLPSLTLGPPVTAGWITQEVRWDAGRDGAPNTPRESSFGVDWLPDRDGVQWSLFSSGRLKPLAFKASLYGNRIGNYSAADGRKVPARHEDWGASLSIAGKSGHHWFHSLDSAFHKQFFSENVSLPLDVEDGEFIAVAASHEWRASAAADWRLRLRYGFTESDSILSNERRGALPVLVVTDAETRALHADLRWQAAFSGLGTLEFGLDTNHEERLAIRQRGPVLQDFIWPDIQVQQLGLFLESRSRPTETMTLRTGLRWDTARSEARMADRTAFGQPIWMLYNTYNGSLGSETRQDDSVLSMNALLRYEPTETVALYAGAGSSAQVPPPTERYRAFLSALGGGFELGNPALRPERKWELAMGTQVQADALTLQADVFYFHVEDFIWRQRVGSTAGLLPLNPPQTVFSYRNVDAAFAGFEVRGNLRISPHFRIPFSAQIVDARLRESGPDYRQGDSLPERPPAEVRVSGIWDWTLHSVAARFEWALRWTGSLRNELPEVDSLYDRSGSYCLHDLQLTLAGVGAMTVRIGVRNLFNEPYSPYLAPPTSSVRPSSGDLDPGDPVPGPGREWSVSVSAKF